MTKVMLLKFQKYRKEAYTNFLNPKRSIYNLYLRQKKER